VSGHRHPPCARAHGLTRRQTLGAAAALAPTLMLPRRALAAPKGALTLLHTNDTHSRMEPFSSGKHKGQAGVARRATLIKQIRAAGPTLVVDAGDTFQGTPWFNQFQGSVDMQVLGALGYDATAVGNHDFDAGSDRLAANLKLAPQLAAISANFDIGDASPLHGAIQPHVVIARGGLKVGLFGLGIKFEGLVAPKLHRGITYTDPREAAREQVGVLRDKGCDLVIALSHLGYEGDRGEVGDIDWPKDVPGVDYVVGGHTHTFLDAPTLIAHASGWQTPVMQVGHSGLLLGKARISVDAGGQVRVASTRPVPVRPLKGPHARRAG
jgi:5'-nucleotidase